MSDYPLRVLRLALAGLLALLPALAAQAGDARGFPVPLQPVTALANGVNHACAIAEGGKVYCWGYNLYGQLGSGDDTSTIDPTPVRGLPGPAVSVAAGMHHSCAVVAGKVWCWGNNDFGQLGNSNPDGNLAPVAVQGLDGNATAVTAGYYHTCALVDNGIKCWGSNAYGSLGNGTDDDSYQPVGVTGLSGPFSQIAAGLLHTCAINAEGLWCWGYNFSGQIGNSTRINQYEPVVIDGLPAPVQRIAPGSEHSCAALTNGSVYCWGANGAGQLGTGGSDPATHPVAVTGLAGAASAVASGALHSCAKVADRVQCWGDNTYNQIGSHPDGSAVPVNLSTLSGVADVSARTYYGCARLNDASLTCWGYNLRGQLGDASALLRTAPVHTLAPGSGVSAVAAGSSHSCAAVPEGLKCWGYNALGALGLGEFSVFDSIPNLVHGFVRPVTSVSAGNSHTCAVYDGGVWCWGDNEYGQLGIGEEPAQELPQPVPGLANGVSQVSAGENFACALRLGAVWCWGAGANGQLGNAAIENSFTPVQVSGLGSGVSMITTGVSHACAVQNGAAKCWGLNTDGQLGLGSNDYLRNKPQQVSGLESGVTLLTGGYTHTCAVVNGGARCWGYDGYGQLGNGIYNDSSYVPQAVVGLDSGVQNLVAGDDVTCAVHADSVLCWGADYDGDLGNGGPARTRRLVPSPVLGMSNIAAGPLAIRGTHVCAATRAGGLYCWGDDLLGALGIGRAVLASKPRPVLRQDQLFANGLD